jgi:hypothetical protein
MIRQAGRMLDVQLAFRAGAARGSFFVLDCADCFSGAQRVEPFYARPRFMAGEALEIDALSAGSEDRKHLSAG